MLTLIGAQITFGKKQEIRPYQKGLLVASYIAEIVAYALLLKYATPAPFWKSTWAVIGVGAGASLLILAPCIYYSYRRKDKPPGDPPLPHSQKVKLAAEDSSGDPDASAAPMQAHWHKFQTEDDDRDRVDYYWNSQTGKSQWDPPPGWKEPTSAAPARTTAKTKSPWKKHFDDTYQAQYWYNTATGESIWTAPPGWVET